MPSFPLTSLQSPEIMTSSIGMQSRLSAGEITVRSHTKRFILFSLSFEVMRHSLYSSSSSFMYYLLFPPPKWNHEGMTSKGGMLWKVADEIKVWHDKHFGAMHCNFSSLHLVFYVHAVSHHFLLSLGLIVFTLVIRVFCIVLAGTYLTLTFRCWMPRNALYIQSFFTCCRRHTLMPP